MLAWCSVLMITVGGYFPAKAQIPPTVSQLVGVNQSIVDERGEPLRGTDKFSYQYGIPSVEGDLIQILVATDGTIYPPNADGTPDSRNPTFAETRIGAGVSPMLPHSGRFSAALAARPSGGMKIFVRAFNAPSIEEASFYGDSQIFLVSSFSNNQFRAEITSTDKPLDGGDADGDGLNNALETSQGSDPYAMDTDGDGYSDSDEYVAGTDALGEDSYPVFVSIQPADGGLTQMSWWPVVSGRTYKIYHTPNLADAESGMNLAAILVSTGSTHSIVITNSTLADSGAFLFRISK